MRRRDGWNRLDSTRLERERERIIHFAFLGIEFVFEPLAKIPIDGHSETFRATFSWSSRRRDNYDDEREEEERGRRVCDEHPQT